MQGVERTAEVTTEETKESQKGIKGHQEGEILEVMMMTKKTRITG